jgi:hypothetical protein
MTVCFRNVNVALVPLWHSWILKNAANVKAQTFIDWYVKYDLPKTITKAGGDTNAISILLIGSIIIVTVSS